MKKPMMYALLLGGFIALQSCGGSTETKTEAPAETAVAKTETAPVQEEPFAAGKKIYMEKCIVCHQANGQGISGAFPSLVGSEFLLTNKVGAIAQTLNGAPGGSTIKGIKYSAPMPFQVDTKEDAVAVINFVLNSFGNNGGTVTMDDAKDIVIKPRP